MTNTVSQGAWTHMRRQALQQRTRRRQLCFECPDDASNTLNAQNNVIKWHLEEELCAASCSAQCRRARYAVVPKSAGRRIYGQVCGASDSSWAEKVSACSSPGERSQLAHLQHGSRDRLHRNRFRKPELAACRQRLSRSGRTWRSLHCP